jgi:hypothetical protein
METAYRSEHTRPQSPFVPVLLALCRCMLSLGSSCPVYTNVSLDRKGSNLSKNREDRTRTYPTLNAPNTTQLFISRLLPLGNQPVQKKSQYLPTTPQSSQDNARWVRIFLLQKPIIQFLRYRLPFIIQLVDIPRARVRDTHDRPQRLGFPLSLVRLVLRISHFLGIVV